MHAKTQRSGLRRKNREVSNRSGVVEPSSIYTCIIQYFAILCSFSSGVGSIVGYIALAT
jgi:hypothetical protein